MLSRFTRLLDDSFACLDSSMSAAMAVKGNFSLDRICPRYWELDASISGSMIEDPVFCSVNILRFCDMQLKIHIKFNKLNIF